MTQPTKLANGKRIVETMEEVSARNREISRQELADFVREFPERYFAYHRWVKTEMLSGAYDPNSVGVELVTFMGDKLGEVISRGRTFRGNLGDKRQHFRAVCINGMVYSGTAYLDSGTYVRLRLVKRASTEELARASRLSAIYREEASK